MRMPARIQPEDLKDYFFGIALEKALNIWGSNNTIKLDIAGKNYWLRYKFNVNKSYLSLKLDK